MTEFASCNAVYFPATHVEHGPPAGPSEPALHEQSVTRELPAGVSECGGQAVQVDEAAAPATAEYVPAGQLRHADCVAAPADGVLLRPQARPARRDGLLELPARWTRAGVLQG